MRRLRTTYWEAGESRTEESWDRAMEEDRQQDTGLTPLLSLLGASHLTSHPTLGNWSWEIFTTLSIYIGGEHFILYLFWKTSLHYIFVQIIEYLVINVSSPGTT